MKMTFSLLKSHPHFIFLLNLCVRNSGGQMVISLLQRTKQKTKQQSQSTDLTFRAEISVKVQPWKAVCVGLSLLATCDALIAPVNWTGVC